MYRILFVDDEALIREGVSENVPWEDLGYELAGTCDNGREASEFLRQSPVDVVMTDICMPFMDGMELSAFIQEEFPQIKVLILSGYDDFTYAKQAIKYGVEEYILKPITSCELGEVLTELRGKLDKEREEQRRRSDMYTAYRKSKLLLCADALMNVITGSRSGEECARELADVGIKLQGGFFLAGVAGLSIYCGDYKLNEKRKKESALMAFIVFNLSQEIMQKYGGGEVCQGRDNRVYLLFQTNAPEEFREQVDVICREIIAQTGKIMNMSLNIGLGDFRSGIGNIYQSYEEAEEALSMQYTAGEGCVIDIRDYREAEDLRPQVERVCDNVFRHVREYDREKLGRDLRELEQLLRQSGWGRKEAADTLLKLCEETGRLRKLLSRDHEDTAGETAREIREAFSMQEALRILGEYMLQVLELLERSSGSGGRAYAYQAMQYIEEHYADSSLSLQAVCSHLGVSTSRFSSVFKQTFGATFMDVLIGIRMKQARELLTMTELKNYEIAERVGFSDPHYFSIAFKKATGKTPTEYARERKCR